MIMKNVERKVRTFWFAKTKVISSFIFGLGMFCTGFKAAAINEGEDKRKANDSITTDKNNFRSFFSESEPDLIKTHSAPLNPVVVPFVQDFIAKNNGYLDRLKAWGKPYFDIYDGILFQHGLPLQLKYLSVVESGLKAGLVSVAGAVGPWQIMPFEAKRLGLKVKGRVDERNNYYKSTQAAAGILKSLFNQFNDWLLVIAAYNAGAGRVNQAIRQSGSRNFWTLQRFLPKETRSHVKKFISTQYFFEGSGGVTTMTAAEVAELKTSMANEAKLKNADYENTHIIAISGRYNAAVIARNLRMDLVQFNKLNPDFDKLIASGNTYNLRLPNEKGPLFEEKKRAILQESVMSLLK